MVFVTVGVIAGSLVLGGVDLSSQGHSVKLLAEATLSLVLFADASRIDLRSLRSEHGLPVRLLAIGLPLTILAGALAASALFDALTFTEAIVLAVLLAPTDAALGQAVVTEPRLPARVRQGLNVESGLNDGICVPLLLIVLATAEVESNVAGSGGAARIVVEEIGYGVAAGLVVGALLAFTV